jgi:hypothetical protein
MMAGCSAGAVSTGSRAKGFKKRAWINAQAPRQYMTKTATAAQSIAWSLPLIGAIIRRKVTALVENAASDEGTDHNDGGGDLVLFRHRLGLDDHGADQGREIFHEHLASELQLQHEWGHRDFFG